MKKAAMIFALILAVEMLSVGCNKTPLPEGMPKLYPTTLTFTLDGKPLEGAIISCYPGILGFNWPIGGTTNAQGKIDLFTAGKFQGAPEGDLTICVKKMRTEEGPSAANKPEKMTLDEQIALSKKMAEERKFFYIVGPQYEAKESSPLKVTITKGKNAPAAFDISEDGTEKAK